jgi:hypothetical protein
LRRRFVKQMRNTKSPIAEAAVRQIAALYAVEATVRGMAPADRLAARRNLSVPIVEALRPWFEKQLSMISSGSTLATDIRYALAHWEGLTRFLGDGRLELDTNPVENAIRPVALTRKNALFAGHEVGAENWALLASIVATCKLNEVKSRRVGGRESAYDCYPPHGICSGCFRLERVGRVGIAPTGKAPPYHGAQWKRKSPFPPWGLNSCRL